MALAVKCRCAGEALRPLLLRHLVALVAQFFILTESGMHHHQTQCVRLAPLAAQFFIVTESGIHHHETQCVRLAALVAQVFILMRAACPNDVTPPK